MNKKYVIYSASGGSFACTCGTKVYDSLEDAKKAIADIAGYDTEGITENGTQYETDEDIVGYYEIFRAIPLGDSKAVEDFENLCDELRLDADIDYENEWDI